MRKGIGLQLFLDPAGGVVGRPRFGLTVRDSPEAGNGAVFFPSASLQWDVYGCYVWARADLVLQVVLAVVVFSAMAVAGARWPRLFEVGGDDGCALSDSLLGAAD